MKSKMFACVLGLTAAMFGSVVVAQQPVQGNESGPAKPGAIEAPWNGSAQDQSPFVGRWGHREPETANSSSSVSIVTIYPNGTWEQRVQIAPRGNLVGTLLAMSGSYSANGNNSIVLQSSRSAMSDDGVSWIPTQTLPPMLVQMNGRELVAFGWTFTRL